MAKYRFDSSYDQLLPTFKAACDRLVQAMAARGYEAICVDALRTPTEAQRNAARGTGIKNSMHLYGCSADWVEQNSGWTNAEFYVALGEEAKKLKLVWGGVWSKPDRAHVQGIGVGWQNKMRALGMDPATIPARDKLVQQWLSRKT